MSTTVSHLLWSGKRWIAAVKVEGGWQFWNGRDAADYLLAEQPEEQR